jgi:hypothetical protein
LTERREADAGGEEGLSDEKPTDINRDVGRGERYPWHGLGVCCVVEMVRWP